MKNQKNKEIAGKSCNLGEVDEKDTEDIGGKKPTRTLYQTSDGYGFESKNFAENHASGLMDKEIKEVKG